MKKKTVYLILLVFWMGVIFFMSAQPSVESEETSSYVAEIVYVLYDLFLSGTVHLSRTDFIELYLQPIRKLAHFTEFAILGILLYINIREYTDKRNFIYALSAAVLYAMSDEFHQLFVENRYCSLNDVLIDSFGALCGILLCHLIMTKWKKD